MNYSYGTLIYDKYEVLGLRTEMISECVNMYNYKLYNIDKQCVFTAIMYEDINTKRFFVNTLFNGVMRPDDIELKALAYNYNINVFIKWLHMYKYLVVCNSIQCTDIFTRIFYHYPYRRNYEYLRL